ncbi:MAG TPA: hypothetical protein DCP08_07635 [Chloroflexi bacterium]|nr:hypothetical protein [Chloroflexota bacterium]
MDFDIQQGSESALIALVKPTRADFIGDQTALYEHAIWAVTMASAKIPFAFLSEEDLTEKAERYPLLILPRVAWLDEEEVQGVERMLHAGGHLLISGGSGCCFGPLGQFSRRNANVLEKLAGVESQISSKGRSDYSQSAFLRLTREHPLTRTPYTSEGTTIPLRGEQYAIRATKAESLAQFVSSNESQEILSDALTVMETKGGRVVWFLPSVAKQFSYDNSYALRELMLRTLFFTLKGGLVNIWYWKDAARSPLVIDGDVDHPPGVDPECTKYVPAAIDTLSQASFDKYGIYVGARNLEEFPSYFPLGHEHYYNHSYSHPYSHWDERPWAALDKEEIADQIRRCNETFLRLLGRNDQGVFRLPHFQLERSTLTFQVLDDLGYVQESSVGSNYTVTAGFPFHPSKEPWAGVDDGESHFKSCLEPDKNFAVLEVPISFDPSAPDFPNGFCSYNTLWEGVRNRTASPDDYLAMIKEVIGREYRRGGLIHIFADPPDVGYGAFEDDEADYSQAVKQGIVYAKSFDDIVFMSPRELVDWWSAREKIEVYEQRITGEVWDVRLRNAVPGTTLCLKPPEGKVVREGRTGGRLINPKPFDDLLVLLPLGTVEDRVDVLITLGDK